MSLDKAGAPMTYIKIRSDIGGLVDGEMTTVTFRIPKGLKDAGVRAAVSKGMSFSAFVRMCMIEKLSSDNDARRESHE